MTVLVGWILQAIFLYFTPMGWPTPQGALIAVLALGFKGHTVEAMAVGFFWGLGLDVTGLTAFGTQGWLLVSAAFVSGGVSKNLNVEKPLTQIFLTLVGTILFVLGVLVLGAFVSVETGSGRFGWGDTFLSLILNGVCSPLVFSAVSRWVSFFSLPLSRA